VKVFAGFAVLAFFSVFFALLFAWRA